MAPTQRKINYKKIPLTLKPDPFDYRDYLYECNYRDIIPTKVDLRDYIKEQVFNQFNYGSCTANATVGCAQMFLIANKVYEDTSQVDEYDLSRLFNYYTSREADFMRVEDTGAYPRSNLKTATNIGICKEKTWPYSSPVNAKPDDTAYAEAGSFKCAGYYRIDTENQTANQIAYQVKHALAAGYPVMYGFFVHDNFYSVTKQDPFLTWQTGYVHGGHEVMIVGYDDNKYGTLGTFIMKNSWGEQWGDGGYCYMTYDHPAHNGMDLWVMKGFGGFETCGPSQVQPAPPTPMQQFVIDNYLVNPQAVADRMREQNYTPELLTQTLQEIAPDLTLETIVAWLTARTDYYTSDKPKVHYTEVQQFVIDNFLTNPKLISDTMKANHATPEMLWQVVVGINPLITLEDVILWLQQCTMYFYSDLTPVPPASSQALPIIEFPPQI